VVYVPKSCSTLNHQTKFIFQIRRWWCSGIHGRLFLVIVHYPELRTVVFRREQGHKGIAWIASLEVPINSLVLHIDTYY